ncbi:MAG: hypothetical protein M3Y24_11150 [Acidobacteriota bacterium]|nr:hypothetical protein [Acidobacteriota bacterium]
MTNANYAKLTARLIGAWFIFSLLASAWHVFRNDPSRPPLALGLAVLIPLAVFGVWFGSSEGFRQFALSLNPRALTLTQSLRIAGYTFLVLHTYGVLPGSFALPAGWGDIAIGATAPMVAMMFVRAHRNWFISWQALGVFDLTAAVALGTTAQLIDPHAVPTSALTVLPLSVIPTFAVPLFIILHVICIAQARRWSEHSSVGKRLPAV